VHVFQHVIHQNVNVYTYFRVASAYATFDKLHAAFFLI